MSLLDQIPNYRDAVETEQLVRDAAFLGVNDSIAGFEVTPITLLQYMRLKTIRNPVIIGAKSSPEELAAFLWLLNPAYTPVNGTAKKKFMRRRCRHFFPPAPPLLPTQRAVRRWKRKAREHVYNFSVTLKAAKAFMEETMMDKPAVPSSMVGESEAEYFSDPAALCALFGREYHWPERNTLNCPLKRMFQYMNEIKRHSGSKVLFNPSDRIKGNWLRELNRQGGVN